jgi:hypothetical protein
MTKKRKNNQPFFIRERAGWKIFPSMGFFPEIIRAMHAVILASIPETLRVFETWFIGRVEAGGESSSPC